MSQQGRLDDTGSLDSLTGNTGGPVFPDGAQNINVLGTSPIVVNGNPGTNTLSIEDDGTIPTNFTADAGSASPAANNLNVVGTAAQGLTTSGAGSTLTLTNSDASTTQKGVSELATDAETITGTDTARTIVPSSLSAKLGAQTSNGVTYGDGSTNALQWTAGLTDGQLVIGSTAGNPAAANLTSTGATITVTEGANTLNIETAGSVTSSIPVDSGGPGVPSAGSLSILGDSATDFTNSSGLETHVGATTNEIYLENKRWFSEFIVDPSATIGVRGEFTTVQAAITAASAAGGGIVYIREGIYTEDLTLAADVSLVGIQANLGNKVQIHGTMTVEYTGRVDIENIFFQTTGASLFVSTSGTPQLLITNCFFVSTSGPICLSSNASLGIIIDFCGFIPVFADIFSMSAGSLTLRYCNINAFFGIRKRVLASGTAVYDCRFNILNHFIETQGTASISLFNNSLDTTTTTTFNVNSAGSTITSINNNVNSIAASGDFAIGTGTFIYGENTLPGTALDINATLTQTAVGSRPRCTGAASAATVSFGTAGFDSAHFTVTDGFVQAGGAVATSYTADTGSAVPAAGVLTVSGGTGIDTSGAGSTLTIDSTSGGVSVTEVTVTGPTSMTEDGAFIANNAGQVDLALPTTATLGSVLKVNGKGAGGWIISQNAGQTIHFLAQDTTTGAGGSLASSTQYDCVTLRCITVDTDFVVESVTGNLTVT